MKKIHLQSIKQAAQEIHMKDGKAIMFSSDYERIDKMIEWLFDNTKHRFVILGTDTVYFEDDDDAILFMMTWG